MNTTDNTSPTPTPTHWDAIVIGSGIGGLVCAAYLAVGGKRVLVAEQGAVAGGNSHVFRRRRVYEFDVGVHYLGDCGPDGILPAILDGLGLRGRVPYEEMDPDGFDRIVAGGTTLDMPADWKRYRERLQEACPEDAAGIDTFLDVVEGLGRERRDAIISAADVPMAELEHHAPQSVAWGRRTLTELFDHCALSTRARTLLAAQSPNYGMSPDEATVATHATLIDHYVRGAYYPQGGGQMLAGGLLEVIRSHGGALRTRARVTRIAIEDGRTRGVEFADGSSATAPVVVSNADYRRTMLDLVGADRLPRRLAAKTRDARMALPWATVYVALDKDIERHANVWWYRGEDIGRFYEELRSPSPSSTTDFLFMSFASGKDPAGRRICPPGHSNFQLMTLCPPGLAHWGATEGPADGGQYRDDPVYRKEKARLTESVLDAAEEFLGPFRGHITHLETATPLTQERYTLSTGGTPFGMAQWGATGARPDTATLIEGLHIAGANTRYGNGITGSAVSGIACAGQILGRRLMHEVHSGSVLGDPAVLPERGPDWDPLTVSRGLSPRGLS
ncbi:NAD(P)/FAD-dependent oxidoreductase [Streptomyces sp. TBY4]|uniref:phytoene desaturase family protein n=1 Tax=Streptomyces sp. TBY4 TaxID=2962030 RepID=UPI0020B769FB|nr:NAD(P)/FAD-dependent oxidoreductase [Streptomyces sp. TBY4]MCP3755081.1 NAD(P)/FAD-dependent oxidoreductase [Streptomyces sp. TBY4]